MRVASLLLAFVLLPIHAPPLAAQGSTPLAEVQPGARRRLPTGTRPR